MSVFEVEVYEWTWIEYNDGKGGPIDEMGYSTDHTMILQLCEDGSYIIVDDVYDDSEILGPPTSVGAVMSSSFQEPEVAVPTKLTGVNVDAGLDVSALIKYADTWVPHTDTGIAQNTDYYNTTKYTVYGNDCANYVSQCLMEGGMQNDYLGEMNNEDWTGSQWWFRTYEDIWNYDASPPAWRVVGTFVTYWTNQGYQQVKATDTSLFPGNPLVVGTKHLAICVGYNSQGVPVINSHNVDKYHVPYTIYKNEGDLTTIQIIKMYHTSHVYSYYTSNNLFSHTSKCKLCGDKHTEGHTWVDLGSFYRCSQCLLTSSVIPATSNVVSDDVLIKSSK